MRRFLLCLLMIILGVVPKAYSEATVKVGMLKLVSSAPLFLGMEKGFFASEGIKAEAVYFNSAQPISVALASKDIDVAATGLTAGLYNLLGSGAHLKIVADKGREKKGFRLTALMVSNQAWEKGQRSIEALKGQRVGVTQVGSTFHYILGKILEAKGMALKDVEVIPLNGLKNIMDALSSGQIASGFVVQPHASLMEEKGLAKVLMWISDGLDYQIAALVYGERMLGERDLADAFMRAYVKSTRYYYEKAIVPVKARDMEAASEALEIIARYTGVEKGLVAKGLNYNDPDGYLDLRDMDEQLKWCSKNGLVKKDMKPEDVVDMGFVERAVRSLMGSR